MLCFESIPLIPLNSFVGISNYPNQVRKRESQRGFQINILVAGESGLGKHTFINSLFNCDLLEININGNAPENKFQPSIGIQTTQAKIIEGDDNLEVTVIEATGLGDQLNNQKCWKPVLEEIERRLEEYLRAEYSSHPLQNVYDGRIHACLYFIAPHGRGLRRLDVDFLKGIHNRVNIIPIIAKADSMTVEELRQFKVQVMRELEHYQISIFRPPYSDDDNDPGNKLNSRIPYAIVGSNEVIDINGNKYRGRRYPWGDVLVDEPSNFHDFSLMRELLIEEMLIFLREKTESVIYERFRSERLQSEGQESFYKGIFNVASAQVVTPVKKVDEDAIEQKKTESMEALKQKFKAKEQKIAAAEEEIMQKYREIMHDLGEKRKKYEEKLRTFL